MSESKVHKIFVLKTRIQTWRSVRNKHKYIVFKVIFLILDDGHGTICRRVVYVFSFHITYMSQCLFALEDIHIIIQNAWQFVLHRVVVSFVKKFFFANCCIFYNEFINAICECVYCWQYYTICMCSICIIGNKKENCENNEKKLK